MSDVPFRRGMTHEEWLHESGRLDPNTGEVLPPDANAPNVIKQSLVKPATARQIKLYTCSRMRVCGNCVHFDKELGQKALFKQNGVAQIVHDHKWKTEYLGSDPNTMGVCRERSSSSKGLTLTGPTHSAAECDTYRLDPDKAR